MLPASMCECAPAPPPGAASAGQPEQRSAGGSRRQLPAGVLMLPAACFPGCIPAAMTVQQS